MSCFAQKSSYTSLVYQNVQTDMNKAIGSTLVDACRAAIHPMVKIMAIDQEKISFFPQNSTFHFPVS